MNERTTLIVFLFGLVLFAGILNTVMAVDTDPNAPNNITQIQTETFNASLYPDITVEAEAGNVTELDIYGVSQTIHWQGWYGNISGTITLEDAQGNVLYNWTSAEPQGEIYVARSNTITWNNVACFSDAGTWSYDLEEAQVAITSDDPDGVNETFTTTDHPTFYLGSDTITGCPTAWTYVNSAAQNSRFPMVLLEDDANSVAIYTTIIENRDDGNSTDVVGFDGVTHDFQIMVPENGTLGNLVTTTYYFWVQIE